MGMMSLRHCSMSLISFIILLVSPNHFFAFQTIETCRTKESPSHRRCRLFSPLQPNLSPFGYLSTAAPLLTLRLSQIDNEEAMKKSDFYEYPPSALPNANEFLTINSANTVAKVEGSADSNPQMIIDLLTIPLEPSFERIMDSAKATRLLKYRSYARREAFMQETIDSRPTLGDLSPPSRTQLETLWISPWYRWVILLGSYLIFPKITAILENVVSQSSTELAEITNQFAPGIAVLYGTFISYTLSILYERQNKIQTNVSIESSVLTIVCRNTLALFRDDPRRLLEGSQCIADQIRHLVKESRGEELMCLIYSDPYSKIYELLLDKERDLNSKDHPDTSLISCSKDAIKDLIKLRSQRLSDEALALPPTHFFVLTTLTILILLGYTVSVLPTVTSTGIPSIASSLLFSVLCTVYVLFYNFANDLNNPFQGVYQIRRSSTAAHLLQIKWLIVNHPSLKGLIHFDKSQSLNDSEETVLVKTPGLGVTRMERSVMTSQELIDH